jgi:hypothetical protein
MLFIRHLFATGIVLEKDTLKMVDIFETMIDIQGF